MKVAVLGSTGYTGKILIRLLMNHPSVKAIFPVSSSLAGESLSLQDPGLGKHAMSKLANGGNFLTREEAVENDPDAVFSALPPGKSAEFSAPFFARSVLFDLSADFRLKDVKEHKRVYGHTAPFPNLRSSSVYGLAEIYREEIRSTNLIAVPGCYPTCILLPLLPLARVNLLKGAVTVNAVSGISGAGRVAQPASMFVERAENVQAYNPGIHRHIPEIQEHLFSEYYQEPLFFTPHLVPMRRGMEATITFFMPFSDNEGQVEDVERNISDALEGAYAHSPCVELRKGDVPGTRDVVGSNRCDIGWKVIPSRISGREGCMIYLFSVIDNLMKGASGQAVQDFNIRFGLGETEGLPLGAEV